MNYKCKNCGEDIEHRKPFGWCHIVATGCISPRVDKKDWQSFLKDKKNENNKKKNIQSQIK